MDCRRAGGVVSDFNDVPTWFNGGAVMRVLGRLVLVLAGMALLAGPALAQFGPPQGGRGGGGLLGLLQRQDVQKELGMEEEDVAKIPEAVMDALKKILKPDQLKRLEQLDLQRRGNRAFADQKVQQALKFTDDQKEQVKTILEDSAKQMQELFAGFRRGGGGGGDFQERMKKVQELNKETTKKIDEVLTTDQKKKWKAMLGKPFQFEQQGFGRGRGRGRGPE
jgi:hypothetical protein